MLATHPDKGYRICARVFYETPVRFWARLLDDCLHFHLGHFPSAETGLAESMRFAVLDLASQVPKKAVSRVLDIGCGWGGPAFELAKHWGSEVIGFTVSRCQARYTNRVARRNGLPVRARKMDIETARAGEFGRFDVVWMDEVLEHIADRRSTLRAVHSYMNPGGVLAIDVCCRAPGVPRHATSSNLMGVYPLDSLTELEVMLEESGWTILGARDCTLLTLPVWDLWIANLAAPEQNPFRALATALAIEFAALRNLYYSGLLHSMQIVACAQKDTHRAAAEQAIKTPSRR